MSDTPRPEEQPRRPDLSAGQTPAREQGRSAGTPPRFSVGKVVRWAMIVLLAVLFGRFFLGRDNPAPAPVAQDEVAPTPGKGAPGKEVSVEQATIEAIRQRQIASVRLQRSEIISLEEEVEKALDVTDSRVQTFKTLMASLLTGEPAKKVAANQALVKRYLAVSEQPLPPTESGAKAKQLLAEAVEPLKAAQTNSADATAVPEDLRQRLEKQLKAARDSALAYEKLTEELQAIIADAPGEAGKKTLEEAAHEVKLEEARQRAALVAARREEVRKKGDEAIAEEQAKQEAVAKTAELKRLKELGEVKKKTDEERRVTEKKEAELNQRVAFVRSAEGRRQIDTYLQPFTAPGYTQAIAVLGGRTDRSTKKGPMSFSRLQTAGLLNDDVKSLFFLACVANSGVNDRPHWQLDSPMVSPATLSPTTIEFLKNAQSLLRDYGDAMVEEGLLSK